MKNVKILLILIFLLGAFLRLYPNNWDAGTHLHPDERFLTMVGNKMELPKDIATYFNQAKSPFNPANLDFDFFVYGIFPLTITKFLAMLFSMDTYELFTLLGRGLSALLDILTLFLVYKIASFLEKKYHLPTYSSILSTFAYAFFVLPIQLSHFFTVDMFVQFFLVAAFYFFLRFRHQQSVFFIILAGIFFGLSLASKISAIFILPLFLMFFFVTIFFPIHYGVITQHVFHAFWYGIKHRFVRKTLLFTGFSLLFLGTVYLSLRLGNPYIFSDPSLLIPFLSSDYVQDIQTLKSFDNPDGGFPPSVQWVTKLPIFFSLFNLSFFGVGIVFFVFILIGIFLLLKKYQHLDFFLLIFWCICFFLYQSTQFVKTMRYFLILYPFFAIFAGVALAYFYQKLNRVVFFFILFLCLLWPIAFYSIYLHPHTRVSASHWIYNTIPKDKVLLIEHWDDPVPLSVNNPLRKSYTIEQLPVFDIDSDEKWKRMDALFEKGDYLILSSNRGYGSIPTIPKRYPRMKKYYEQLLTNTHPEFKLVRTFTSYPSFSYLGIPVSIPDSISDEAFTVYDHPEVLIFKKK